MAGDDCVGKRKGSPTVRYLPKPGSDARVLRGHTTEPASIAVLLGLSFERESDRIRIESFLKQNPTTIVMSVSLHPQPNENEMEVLGVIKKFWPNRYAIFWYNCEITCMYMYF